MLWETCQKFYKNWQNENALRDLSKVFKNWQIKNWRIENASKTLSKVFKNLQIKNWKLTNRKCFERPVKSFIKIDKLKIDKLTNWKCIKKPVKFKKIENERPFKSF